jgi:hypothetical protein
VAIEFPGPSNVTEPLVVSDDQDHVGAGAPPWTNPLKTPNKQNEIVVERSVFLKLIM